MKEIFNNIKNTCEKHNAQLVAVSKKQPIKGLKDLYQWGQRDFGENKVQDLIQRKKDMPKDIRWHMIGHLQRNKVKYIADFIHLIHSVDSLNLLEKIDKEAKRVGRIIPCLLQVKIAEEISKYGFKPTEISKILYQTPSMENIHIKGLMGMGTQTHNPEKTTAEFRSLHKLFTQVRYPNYTSQPLNILSMGMSHDYKIALAEGANLIRVGRLLFEENTKPNT
ncbi:MAG: YggS family pyridoxal phosphate-dependent enzyme [Cytophagales bacterium]|nr:YggS family pyridoxal phosphate-dependent enzyme [Cytophagales bacterium]